MIYDIRGDLLEIKSSTYPENIRVIKRISDGAVFGCVVYSSAEHNSIDDFEEIDAPTGEETEENE